MIRESYVSMTLMYDLYDDRSPWPTTSDLHPYLSPWLHNCVHDHDLWLRYGHWPRTLTFNLTRHHEYIPVSMTPTYRTWIATLTPIFGIGPTFHHYYINNSMNLTFDFGAIDPDLWPWTFLSPLYYYRLDSMTLTFNFFVIDTHHWPWICSANMTTYLFPWPWPWLRYHWPRYLTLNLHCQQYYLLVAITLRGGSSPTTASCCEAVSVFTVLVDWLSGPSPSDSTPTLLLLFHVTSRRL